MNGPVQQAYERAAGAGDIKVDPAQQALIAAFEKAGERLASANAGGKGLAARLFAPRGERKRLRGVYVHGGVGRGKTMIMDLFFATVAGNAKRRAHFNDFMEDVHGRVGRIREQQRRGEVWDDIDPVRQAAGEIAGEARLICFDEFQVNDIADAMILGRLFTALIDNGVMIVATSNVAPSQLYRDGLNRSAFEPFIDLIESEFDVVEVAGGRDHRLDKLAGQPVYFTPLGQRAQAAMEDIWRQVSGSRGGESEVLTVKGRQVVVPRQARGAAWLSFAQLCEAALGAGDYIALAARYGTILVSDIPVLGEGRDDATRRFITMVDTCYDRHVRLICSAAAPIRQLCQGGRHVFSFERTASRLEEMGGREWWEAVKRLR